MVVRPVGRTYLELEVLYSSDKGESWPNGKGAETDVTTRKRTKAEKEQEVGLMEAVSERGNLWLAYDRVTKNKGAAGVDGIGIAEFKEHLKQHWPSIKAKLLAGEYMPRTRYAGWTSPSREAGSGRLAARSTLTDRLIQQALHQVLLPIFESNYGFRPERNAHQAVKAAWRFVAEGRRVVVDMDLEKFFDRVIHDLLMQKLSTKIKGGRVLRLICRYLEAGMMADGIVSQRTEDTRRKAGP
jgi:RNA-directed DNA polymerase